MIIRWVGWKAEWKSALADGGEQCVMTYGTTMMLKSFVGNLVLEQEVNKFVKDVPLLILGCKMLL